MGRARTRTEAWPAGCLRRHVAGDWRDLDARGYAANDAQQLYAATGWTSLASLHRLKQPTLVLPGNDDPLVPVINAKLLASRISRAALAVVPGGGHLMLRDSARDIWPNIRRLFSAQ